MIAPAGLEARQIIDPAATGFMRFVQGHRIEAVAMLACITLMVLVFELVRRRQIKERYSFLWFVTCASLLLLTLKREWLHQLAALLGIYYPPTALFLVLNFFIIVILVHFSIVLSRLMTQNQTLAQKVALLEAELASLHDSKVRPISKARKDG
jgi:hypothetical protein